MKTVLTLTLVLIILSSGCVQLPKTNSIASQCIALCQEALKENKNLSNGHCLSDNNSNWKIDNWVCDVAHSPRQDVDNQRENQCDKWWDGYQKGNAPYFTEVTPNCDFIRTG